MAISGTTKLRDAEAIERHLAERGVTQLPAAAAFVLGESTPGWRRDAERRTDATGARKLRRTGGMKTRQNSLAERLGAERIVTDRPKPPQRKRTNPLRVMCRFFDKLCIAAVIHDNPARAQQALVFLTGRYGGIGARFFISADHVVTEHSWSATVKPLLKRQLARRV